MTVTLATLLAPSASDTIASARRPHACATASSQLRVCNRTGESARQQHDRVVGRAAPVDRHLVEALRDGALEDLAERLEARSCASVVSTASIVAMSGASIAAPLAMPPDAEAGCLDQHLFRGRVRRHHRDGGLHGLSPGLCRERRPGREPLLEPADRERDADQTRLADEDLLGRRPDSSGNELAHALRARAALPRRSARWRSRSSTTTAAARPPVESRCARLTRTGAALALLLVNTAAAGTATLSCVHKSARSGAPDAFMPQAAPAATKPRGPVTLTGTPPPSAAPSSRVARM